MIRALALIALLGACAAPRADVYRAKDGAVSTRVSGGVGPLAVGVNDRGAGTVSTRIGPVRLGAGF